MFCNKCGKDLGKDAAICDCSPPPLVIPTFIPTAANLPTQPKPQGTAYAVIGFIFAGITLLFSLFTLIAFALILGSVFRNSGGVTDFTAFTAMLSYLSGGGFWMELTVLYGLLVIMNHLNTKLCLKKTNLPSAEKMLPLLSQISFLIFTFLLFITLMYFIVAFARV